MELQSRYEDFLLDVMSEIRGAKEVFPTNDKLHIAFTEEAGEVSKALLDCHRDEDTEESVYNEAVQAAAMACRLACEGDPDFEYTPEILWDAK